MANFNRLLRKDAGGGREGYMVLAATAGEQRTAASLRQHREQRAAWSSSACERDVDVSNTSDIKVGWICTPCCCIPGLRGEEELDQNPSTFSVVSPGG